MCGIIGSINKALDKSLLDLIAHRGPDDRGWYEHAPVTLGHVRLSIQDVSENGHQPFVSKDGKTVMVFNGEIYNHWEIREGLEKTGIKFNSNSDTETVLEGYLKYGSGIFEKLNGIFALAIYDITKNCLSLVRDRFGVKPLYYSLDNNQLQFSSELKAIDFSPDKIDYEALSNYIKFLWCPGKGTPSKQIRKVLPGEYITFDLAQEKLIGSSSSFFEPKFNGKTLELSEVELIDQLDNLLNQSVKRQLLSDVPVGFFLSGGLDSSLLVAIARKLRPKDKIQCFTIDTTEFSKSEGFSNDIDYAKIVAEYLDVDLDVVNSKSDILDDFDRMIWHLDEPQADPAPLNVLNISKRAKEMGYKVLIGGAGGDDVFSGYRRHQMLKYEGKISKIPQVLLNVLGSIGQRLRPSSPNKRRVGKILSTFSKPKSDRIYTYFDWLSWDKVKGLFTPEIKSQLDTVDEYQFFRNQLRQIPLEKNLLNQMLHLEMTSFLVDHNFNYTDKMGMAAGVEIRVPFLDNDLVDFSCQIPPDYKLKGNTTKYILKKVAERYLPNDVIYRSKAGFGAPVRKWVTEDLSELIQERLSEVNLRNQMIFNPSAVQKLINENRNGEIDASYSIWAILAIDSWIRQFSNPKIN